MVKKKLLDDSGYPVRFYEGEEILLKKIKDWVRRKGCSKNDLTKKALMEFFQKREN